MLRLRRQLWLKCSVHQANRSPQCHLVNMAKFWRQPNEPKWMLPKIPRASQAYKVNFLECHFSATSLKICSPHLSETQVMKCLTPIVLGLLHLAARIQSRQLVECRRICTLYFSMNLNTNRISLFKILLCSLSKITPTIFKLKRVLNL